MRKHEQPITATEMMDAWKGKKVKILNSAGEIEDGWEVIAASTVPKLDVTVIKLNKYNQVAKRRVVDWQDFIKWQLSE